MLKAITRKIGTLASAALLAGCIHTYTGPMPSAYNLSAMSGQQLYSNLEYLLNEAANTRRGSCKVNEEGFGCDFSWRQESRVRTKDGLTYSVKGEEKFQWMYENFSDIFRVLYDEGGWIVNSHVRIKYKSKENPGEGCNHWGSSVFSYEDKFKAREVNNILLKILSRKGVSLPPPQP